MLDNGADYCQVHAATENDPPFQKRTWLKANPSLKWMPDLELAIRREAAKAKRDATLLPSFLALRLNMGVGDVAENLLLEAGTWESIEGNELAEGPYALGHRPRAERSHVSSSSLLASDWPAGFLRCLPGEAVAARAWAPGWGG